VIIRRDERVIEDNNLIASFAGKSNQKLETKLVSYIERIIIIVWIVWH